MRTITKAFLIIMVLRFSQLCLDYNYDQPDQYWQGHQIAFKIANHYGHQTWEWTGPEPIRNPLYQLYLSLAYRISNHFGLKDNTVESMARGMQMLLGCLCDWYLLKTATRFASSISLGQYMILLTNWFYFSMLNRTYSNSAQTTLTLIALYYWQARRQSIANQLISRSLVCLSFLVRPTSIIPWVVIWPYQFIRYQKDKLLSIIKNGLTLLVMLQCSMGLSYWWYGRWLSVDYNFFKYNIVQRWSELYGTQGYWYYFSTSLPLILGGYLVFLVRGVASILPNMITGLRQPTLLQLKKQASQEQNKAKMLQLKYTRQYCQLLLLVGLILLVLSFTAHKQHRFLLVIAPLLLIICLKGIKQLKKYPLITPICLAINLLLFSTIVLHGKQGSFQLLRQVRNKIDQLPIQIRSNPSLLYLCQPHSLPLYSVIQRNITVKFIDTSPPRKLQGFNQQHQLTSNPQQLYNKMTNGTVPTFVVMQSKYGLTTNGFKQQYSFLLDMGYVLISSHRAVNAWEEWWNGWDSWMLLQKRGLK